MDPDGTIADIGAHVYYHASGPYIWIDDLAMNDIIGDNDQKADVGETVELVVTLTNTGLDGSGINAKLTTNDTDIDILQAEANFGDMLRDGNSTNDNPFKILNIIYMIIKIQITV